MWLLFWANLLLFAIYSSNAAVNSTNQTSSDSSSNSNSTDEDSGIVIIEIDTFGIIADDSSPSSEVDSIIYYDDSLPKNESEAQSGSISDRSKNKTDKGTSKSDTLMPYEEAQMFTKAFSDGSKGWARVVNFTNATVVSDQPVTGGGQILSFVSPWLITTSLLTLKLLTSHI